MLETVLTLNATVYCNTTTDMQFALILTKLHTQEVSI